MPSCTTSAIPPTAGSDCRNAVPHHLDQAIGKALCIGGEQKILPTFCVALQFGMLDPSHQIDIAFSIQLFYQIFHIPAAAFRNR